jgi:cellulose synthase/poly-beta-1,6-N-acetylglucosamine synthase-like glycosyltransferase
VIRDLLVVATVGALAYYLATTAFYLVVHVAGLAAFRDELRERSWGPMYQQFSSPFLPGVAIVVPAYDEEAVIVETVQSLLSLNYPDLEIVVVDDGSTDETLVRLREAFDLERVDAGLPVEIPCEPVHGVYRSAEAEELRVVHKDNGGKGDALNAGIWLTDQPLFGAIDADTLLDRDGLIQVVRPFLEEPERTVASGGTVRVANGCDVRAGTVTRTALPGNWLARLQVVEYLRAFYSGRVGLNRLRSLLIISGAFGVFRTDLVRSLGGYDPDNITEDFELVIRLHRELLARGEDYRVEFVPEPVAWTQVPTTLGALGDQRSRWYRGLVATLVEYRDMIGRRRYGRVGLVAVPVYLFVEALGRLVEGAGYVLVVVAALVGAVDPWFLGAYVAITFAVGLLLSWFGVCSEIGSFRRYDRPRQVLALFAAAVVENLGYRQWRTAAAWRGLLQYLLGTDRWGEMRRSAFDE